MIRKMSNKLLITLFQIRKEISKLNKSKAFIREYKEIPINAKSTYVQYRSKDSMYKILESDSLFMFCSELSNDKTENKMLHVDEASDVYISCFYNGNSVSSEPREDSSDVLSQWTSYCADGGAAFEYYFRQDFLSEINNIVIDRSKTQAPENELEVFFKKLDTINQRQFLYSIVTSNAVDDSDFVLYPNFPFQIQYYENTINDTDSIALTFQQMFADYNITGNYVLPYFKHSGFVQESEARLAFVNDNNSLSDCIKFIKSSDGTMVPYIEVKFGNPDLLRSPCDFVHPAKGESLEAAIEQQLLKRNPKTIWKNTSKFPIIIPQGRDQEKIYNAVEKVINKLSGTKARQTKPKIICQGHLPITKITLAPTEDREQQKKKMEIFCKSKYWLRNVEIVESKIPYNTKNSNHT